MTEHFWDLKCIASALWPLKQCWKTVQQLSHNLSSDMACFTIHTDINLYYHKKTNDGLLKCADKWPNMPYAGLCVFTW
jgi:hypothetical protein